MLFSQGGRVDVVLEVKTLVCSVPVVEILCNVNISVNKFECSFGTGKANTPMSY